MRFNIKNNDYFTGRNILPVFVLVSLVASPQLLSATMKGVFQAPDITTFILHGESDGDGDGDGVKETHIRRYLNKSGDSVFSMTSGKILWAWSLNTNGSDDAALNYVIRDSNCDGTFDEKYGLDDEFHVPECVNKN